MRVTISDKGRPPTMRKGLSYRAFIDEERRQATPREAWRRELARSERFELPTLGFEVRCSIQLSYERVGPFRGWPGLYLSAPARLKRTVKKVFLAGFGYQSWAARARRLIGGSCGRTAAHSLGRSSVPTRLAAQAEKPCANFRFWRSSTAVRRHQMPPGSSTPASVKSRRNFRTSSMLVFCSS